MCGISGFYSPRRNISISDYYHSHSRLRHRGPDDEGLIWHTKEKTVPCRGDGSISSFDQRPHIKSMGLAELVLGHYRLSILDTSDLGHQPMHFDGLWLTYNGEVYNYLELKTDLESKGYTFETETDTEVVLKSLHYWGKEAVNHFNGMWAFALFNTNTDKLFLCRDRFGIKPLYYAMVDEDFFFASEAKFFKGLFPLSINEERAADYLNHCWVDHDVDSMLEPVKQLLPAHILELDLTSGKYKTERYWNLEVKNNYVASLDVAIEEFNEIFSSSLDLRMRSDVPVGALLSGGLDSTSIICNLNSRDKLGKNEFHTYSAVFKEKNYSEREQIEHTLKFCDGLNHHWVSYNVNDVINELDVLIYQQDFPFRSLAVFSQMELYKKIFEVGDVTVLLNGQGADELFGGYTNHYIPRIGSAIQNLSFKDAWNEVKHYRINRKAKYKNIFFELTYSLLTLYYPGLRRFHKGRELSVFNGKHNKDIFNDTLVRNLLDANLPEYLRYEDRNSMMFSKEARLPFLDYRLVEWAFKLPRQLKIQNGITKYIQRKSVEKYTTPEIVASKDKLGFISPQLEWQKNQLKSWIDERQSTGISGVSEGNSITNPFARWRAACFSQWKEHIW